MIKRFGVVIGVSSRPHGQKNWALATGPRNCQTGTQHQQRAAASVRGDVAQVGVAQEASVRDTSQCLMWGHVGPCGVLKDHAPWHEYQPAGQPMRPTNGSVSISNRLELALTHVVYSWVAADLVLAGLNCI